MRWLGFDWGDNLFHASDYFEQLYDFAVELIRLGKAYVDSLSEDEIREYRGTVTEPGRDSPYRDRSVEENLDLFTRMRTGEFPDGAHVLRGKIDMASPNMKMRDPLLLPHQGAPRTTTAATPGRSTRSTTSPTRSPTRSRASPTRSAPWSSRTTATSTTGWSTPCRSRTRRARPSSRA